MAGTAKGRSRSKKSSPPICASSKATYADVEANDDAITRTCRKYFARPEDAEDAAQMVRMDAFRGLDTFRGDANIRTWLYRLAFNRCMNVHRNGAFTRKMTSTSLDEVLESGRQFAASQPSAERIAGSREAVRLLAAKKPLREDLALIAELAKGAQYQTLADREGMTIPGIKSKIIRSRRRLQAALR
jgi:RNA polymerase sigma-70 factor (ECF subfamily)